MKFLKPMGHKEKVKQINVHLLISGFFVIVSYILTLLPLALFAVAQTMAIFGRRRATVLSIGALVLLVLFAIFTGFAPVVLAAVLALIATPLFLVVSILRQKHTSILWSASALLLPISLLFSAVLFAPTLNQKEYSLEIDKIENLVLESKKEKPSTPQNDVMYEKIITQIESLKNDSGLRQYMAYNPGQRLLYFVYGDGFAIFLIVILSFFASLFFLDFAFEQIEKLRAVDKYVKSLSHYSFDPLFLALLKDISTRSEKNENNFSAEYLKEFQIIKHTKNTPPNKNKNPFLGFLRKPNPDNTIAFKNYLFFYSGKAPGWGLRSYQMPLILCLLSIITLSSIVFYYGSVENIIAALAKDGIGPITLLVSSFVAMCVLSFLVLQGIFTALKWIPFGLLVILSIIFLIVSPYILVDLGPFMFLGIFGVVGLLGYLK